MTFDLNLDAVRTLEEIAAEEGLDERSVRRIELAALAKLRALADLAPPELVVRVIVLVLREKSSTEDPAFSRVPRRFSNKLGSIAGGDPARAIGSPPALSSGRAVIVADRRAGLPRRWSKKP